MKKIVIILSGIFITLILSFTIYVNIYYKADEVALTVFDEREDIVINKDITYIPSTTESNIGFIFYPGAKVESYSYLPLLNSISKEGINVYLVTMPFNLAIFGTNKANDVMDEYENDFWYIGGHSMGGAFASSFASGNQEKIDGLILLGAYIYKDYPVEKQITIYGEFDYSFKELDYTYNVFIIEGGNHAYFGNYGEQKNDGKATITNSVQQEQTTNKIREFIK